MDNAPHPPPAEGNPPVAAWPIRPQALDALLDLGLGEGDLARYFHVSLQEVGAARAKLRPLADRR